MGGGLVMEAPNKQTIYCSKKNCKWNYEEPYICNGKWSKYPAKCFCEVLDIWNKGCMQFEEKTEEDEGYQE